MAKKPSDRHEQTEQLQQDLRHLSDTVEELVNATAQDASSEMKDLRQRAEQRLKDTRARVEARGERLYAGTRDSLSQQADCCDRYVRDNPWTSLGIGAAAGVVVGLLLGRR
ncbi:YqjD family protein [Halomonas cibimaris]|uniref:YqjD family protein n=1 Tax=Halomonas cibimaris TaxID=657012 RepID=A0ABP7LHV5_9GAMM